MKSAPGNRKFFGLMVCLSFALAALGQQDLRTIQASFDQYKTYSFTEKIFTHTDKDFYLAGEIVWFKLYVTNAANNKPAELSKLAYVEILNADQKPALQTKVELNNGTGNGSLYLPLTLNSGVYKLRVYTNWMKNFGPAFYFEKSLTIINTLKSLNTQPAPSRSYDIQFFPVGGNLVQGMESQVAFKITDNTGKGINSNGFLLNNNNDTITAFETLKFGMGRFEFTPQTSNDYRAVINLPDTTIIKELPKPLDKGYVLNVKNSSDAQLNITISTNIISTDLVYLFIHARQDRGIAEKIILKNGRGEFNLDKNKLAEGISHITIFNSDLVPVCERLFFTPPKQKIIIQPGIDKTQWASRTPLKIAINTTDESGKFAPADLSVAVYRIDSLQSIQDVMIDNYVWLTSELKGRIESPGYYFSATGSEVEQATDNLMLTQGWSRFNWRNVLQHEEPVYSFIPEYRGHLIYGRVTDKTTGQPAAAVLAYLSIPGSRVHLYSSISDPDGILRFYTKDIYGPNEIVLQTETGIANKYNLELISSFSNKFSQEGSPAFNLSETRRNLLADYSTAMQVQNSFNGKALKQYYIPVIDTNAFFGDPDKRYKLDDYTRFSTMEEVLREYVFEVLVRRQKENFRLIMSDGENKIFMDDPFTLFNGVPVFDPNKIMKYDPLKLREIDIVKNKYFYGPLVLNGIVNFITYVPDPVMLSELNAVILEYEGMQYQREFYSPAYETEEQLSSHLPDFRNTLYWSPNMNTDTQKKTEISFFTSDMKGKYIVVLQGMSADGRVGVNTISFEVK